MTHDGLALLLPSPGAASGSLAAAAMAADHSVRQT